MKAKLTAWDLLNERTIFQRGRYFFSQHGSNLDVPRNTNTVLHKRWRNRDETITELPFFVKLYTTVVIDDECAITEGNVVICSLQ